MNNKNHTMILKMVETAIFAAIVLVIQFAFSSIKLGPLEFSVVLVPIVVGGILIGPGAGAILGGVFGIVTLIAGITGQSPFTYTLLNSGVYPAIVTSLVCVVKAVAAGWGAAMIYKLFEKKNMVYLGVVLAALSAPILNTGIFVIGMFSMYGVIETVFASPSNVSVFYFVMVGCAGINFIAEFIINAVFIPAIDAVVRVVRKEAAKH